jgi:hypothetical protein
VLWLLSLNCVFSQSFQVSKKLYPFSNNIVYQIHLLKDGQLADSIKITSPVYYTFWDTLQYFEVNKNEFIVFHQLIKHNTLTFDTLLIIERYIVHNGNTLVKQSGIRFKKIDNLTRYDFLLRNNNLIVYNKEGETVKSYELSDYANLEDLASDITSNL